MPVQSCSLNGKSGYQYGDSGKCYTYTKGNEASRKRAKRKAHLQGAAVESSSGRKHEIEDQEFDDSLNDYIDMVRREFEMQFPIQYNPDNGNPLYFWVNDVFEDYVVVRGDGKYYEVDFTETEETITFADRKDWRAVRLSYVQEMRTGSFRDVLCIAELKGKYPDIKIFSDIDLKELTDGDPNPVFATLPIGMANVTSGNRRHYDTKFVQEMEKQVREKKPVGIMGHIPTDNRSFSFPEEAVHWVGVEQVNEFLWGKGYFPAGKSRDRIKLYKATNKPIATSIDAEADGVWDNKLEAYHMIAETLDLHQVDIAPQDRAGIPSLAAVPLITQEMVDNAHRKYFTLNGNGSSSGGKMGKEISEMTVADLNEIPQAVKDAMAADAAKAIREQLGIPAGVEVSAYVQEIKKQKEDAAKKVVTDRIAELASHPDNGIKVLPVRATVVEMVKIRNPQTVEQANQYYEETVNSDHIKELLKSVVQETMGPPQGLPVASQSAPTEGKYFRKPEEKGK